MPIRGWASKYSTGPLPDDSAVSMSCPYTKGNRFVDLHRAAASASQDLLLETTEGWTALPELFQIGYYCDLGANGRGVIKAGA